MDLAISLFASFGPPLIFLALIFLIVRRAHREYMAVARDSLDVTRRNTEALKLVAERLAELRAKIAGQPNDETAR